MTRTTSSPSQRSSRGVAVVYTSESLELAVLEALVHLDIDLLPTDYYQVAFELDEQWIARLARELPRNWDCAPPYDPKVQAIGDAWISAASSLAVRVPASVLPTRTNVLINPNHPENRFATSSVCVRCKSSSSFFWFNPLPLELHARILIRSTPFDGIDHTQSPSFDLCARHAITLRGIKACTTRLDSRTTTTTPLLNCAYSGIVSPEPPIAAGKSFTLGRP